MATKRDRHGSKLLKNKSHQCFKATIKGLVNLMHHFRYPEEIERQVVDILYERLLPPPLAGEYQDSNVGIDFSDPLVLSLDTTVVKSCTGLLKEPSSSCISQLFPDEDP